MLDNSQIESKQTTEFFVFCSQEKCKEKKAAHTRHIQETLERKRKEDVRVSSASDKDAK